MDTLGWLLVLGASLLIRGVINGRGFDSFTDLGDGFLAAVEFDNTKLKEVWDRKGNNNTPDTSATDSVVNSVQNGSVQSGFANGVSLLEEMMKIGNGRSYSQAKRTGPDSFDCSGLVWRAGTNIKLWGPGSGTKWFPQAFNTASFIVHTKEIGLTKVDNPQKGDIIWWVGHMGVVVDDTTFYSALSSHRAKGKQIETVSIKSVDTEHGPHQLWRYKANTTAPGAETGAAGGGGGGSW